MPGLNITTRSQAIQAAAAKKAEAKSTGRPRPGRPASPWPISRHESYTNALTGASPVRPVEQHLDLSGTDPFNFSTFDATAPSLGALRLDCDVALQAPRQGHRTAQRSSSSSSASSSLSSLDSLTGSPVSPAGLGAWYGEAGSEKVGDVVLRQVVGLWRAENKARVSTLPGGVELVHLALPAAPNAFINKALCATGQSPYALHLVRDDANNDLFALRNTGARRDVKDGWYAYVIDQDNRLLISIGAPATGNAPQGSHTKLVGGLPVRFAGELQIAQGKVAVFTNQSGHYRPPPALAKQAEAHPLLRDAVSVLVSE